jgi:pimeloyl-ACP methyl ester carboxylesterase
MAEPASHLVTIDDLTHRYLQWGHDDSPVILMLHGLRSYARTWAPVADALTGPCRIIAPDFVGRGESSWDPERDYFTNRYVADVEYLAGLLGLTRFDIVGHSMGGTVGYTYAARHPDQVRSLIVEDIGPDSSTRTAGAQRILREMADTPRDFASIDAVRAYWRGIRPDITDDALASRIEQTVREAPGGRWTWKLDMAGIAAARLSGDPAGPVDLWACVESLQCPTLVIRGARSDFLPVETCVEMAKRQPLLRWAEVADAGHYAHDDNPRAFIQLVREFLPQA